MASPLSLNEGIGLLLRAAEDRLLTPDELHVLSVAASSGARDEIIVSLLMARKAHARSNLMASGIGRARLNRRRELWEIRKNILESSKTSEVRKTTSLPFILSSHAITRFRERYVSDEEQDEVAPRLEREAMTSVPIKERTICGEEQWRSPDGVVFVIKRDGPGRSPICVTIIPRQSDQTHGRRRRR